MTPASLDEAIRQHVLHVLAFTDGNKTKAADILQIGRRTLYRILEKPMQQPERVLMYGELSDALLERMRDAVAQGRFASMDALVDAALEGDPEFWCRHNHVTRDIKKPGECLACDRYHAAVAAKPQTKLSAPAVLCKCCPGGCTSTFRWRGTVRCGCPLSAGGAGAEPPRGLGVVQADLDRE